MTDAINFFQSFKMFGFFSNPKINNSSERKLSRELIKDARNFIAKAEAEAKNAGEAKNLTFTAAEIKLKQSLANIAVWHLEAPAKNYRQAAARYIEAGVLRRDQEKLLRKHSENFMNLAREAETTAERLCTLNN